MVEMNFYGSVSGVVGLNNSDREYFLAAIARHTTHTHGLLDALELGRVIISCAQVLSADDVSDDDKRVIEGRLLSTSRAIEAKPHLTAQGWIMIFPNGEVSIPI